LFNFLLDKINFLYNKNTYYDYDDVGYNIWHLYNVTLLMVFDALLPTGQKHVESVLKSDTGSVHFACTKLHIDGAGRGDQGIVICCHDACVNGIFCISFWYAFVFIFFIYIKKI